MLVEAIMNGEILHGEAALAVHDIIKKFIKAVIPTMETCESRRCLCGRRIQDYNNKHIAIGGG
jgi:hypothetical protein